MICIKRERVDWGGQEKLWSMKEALDEELSVFFLVLLYYEVIPVGSEINIPHESYSLSPTTYLDDD